MFLSEWREIYFGALPCKKKTWWQLASRCCWNRARPWHASELVSFLVGLRTYQHPGISLAYHWLQFNNAKLPPFFYLNKNADTGKTGWQQGLFIYGCHQYCVLSDMYGLCPITFEILIFFLYILIMIKAAYRQWSTYHILRNHVAK